LLHGEPTVDPWIGAAIAFERLTLGTGINATLQSTFNGIVFPRILLGLDLHPVRALSVGPWIAVDIAWYGPEAPAWLTASLPIRLDAGVRAAVAF
jgi:hypothetical protein